MLLRFYGFLYATVISFVSALDDVSHQDLESPNGKICRATGSCTLGNASTQHFPYVNCMCDADCVKFGDCCLDVVNFEDSVQRRAVNEFQCAPIDETLLHNGNRIYSIYRKDSCPSSWANVEIRRKCESPTDTYQDPLVITPVINTLTNITYGNIYCALCNKNSSPIKYWNLGLDCTNSKNESLSSVESAETRCKKSLKYNEHVRSWQVSCDKQVYNCHYTPSAPEDMKSRLRPCINTIKTCPATWTEKHFRERCETYTMVVFDNHGVGQSYRNVHCAMCNNVQFHSLDCKSNFTDFVAPKGPFNPESFAILFDFNRKGCKENEIYDEFLKRCRDLLAEAAADSKDCDVNSTNGCTAPSTLHVSYSFFGVLTALGIGISIVCLCMHLVVFAMLKELRNLSGKNLASLCFSLLVAYCSFVISSMLEGTGKACVINAVVTYYFFLAAFMWMLVMAFDVWRILRIATKELRVSSGKQWRKFLIYSFCSWVLPAKIVLISLLVDLCPLGFVNDKFKPHFGQGGCWFGQGPAILLFFGIPLALILVFNVSFFLSSACMIYSSQSMARYSASPNTKRDFRLYARLALIMGLTWITGIVAGFANNQILWLVFIVLNTSLGLFIFLAFTCKRKILHSLKNLKKENVFNLPAFSWTMNTSDDGRMSGSAQTEKQTSSTYY